MQFETVAPQQQSAPAPTVAVLPPAIEAPITVAVATPAPRRAPAVPERRPSSALVAAPTTIPDSLFDHTADVELVLDPVKLRHERGRGYTPTSVRGEAASITF